MNTTHIRIGRGFALLELLAVILLGLAVLAIVLNRFQEIALIPYGLGVLGLILTRFRAQKKHPV